MTQPDPATEQNPAGDQSNEATEVDWKAEARKWEDRSKENFKKVEKLQPLADAYTALERATKTETDLLREAQAQAVKDAETYRAQLAQSRVALLAANDFADPSDAASAIDVSNLIGADGVIDDEAIKRELTGLLERKPHWRKADGAAPAPRAPVPNPAQGTSGQQASPDLGVQFGAFMQGLRNT